MKQLEAELDKVYTWQRVKASEIIRRITASEREVNEVIDRSRKISRAGNGASHGPANAVANGGASEPAIKSREEEAIEEDFLLLEEDLSDIIADVHDLAKFTQLNYTGFQKIIKKHDVSLLRPISSMT